MGQPVVHFEIIGKDPNRLRSFFGAVFGWEFDTDAPVAREVSEPGNYGFIEQNITGDGTGIPGGIGGGRGFDAHAIFYIGVADVEAALGAAERLGGTRVMGPAANVDSNVVVGHFRDPEGTLIGVAAPRHVSNDQRDLAGSLDLKGRDDLGDLRVEVDGH